MVATKLKKQREARLPPSGGGDDYYGGGGGGDGPADDELGAAGRRGRGVGGAAAAAAADCACCPPRRPFISLGRPVSRSGARASSHKAPAAPGALHAAAGGTGGGDDGSAATTASAAPSGAADVPLLPPRPAAAPVRVLLEIMRTLRLARLYVHLSDDRTGGATAAAAPTDGLSGRGAGSNGAVPFAPFLSAAASEPAAASPAVPALDWSACRVRVTQSDAGTDVTVFRPLDAAVLRPPGAAGSAASDGRGEEGEGGGGGGPDDGARSAVMGAPSGPSWAPLVAVRLTFAVEPVRACPPPFSKSRARLVTAQFTHRANGSYML